MYRTLMPRYLILGCLGVSVNSGSLNVFAENHDIYSQQERSEYRNLAKQRRPLQLNALKNTTSVDKCRRSRHKFRGSASPPSQLSQFIEGEVYDAHPDPDGVIATVGGHGGMTTDPEGHVLKPIVSGQRGVKEVTFYKHTAQFCPRHEGPAKYMPNFYGLERSVNSIPNSHADTPADTSGYLKLEDLTAGYSKPCIMDLKIGVQTWDPAVTESKKFRLLRRYPPQTVIGYRAVGMRVFRPHAPIPLWVRHCRSFGRSLDEHTSHLAFLEYLHDGQRVRTELLEELITQLRDIKDWIATQNEYRFFSTSLLVVFDGDPDVHDPKIKVRMIDFAHVYPMDQHIPTFNKQIAAAHDEYLQRVRTKKMQRRSAKRARAREEADAAGYDGLGMFRLSHKTIETPVHIDVSATELEDAPTTTSKSTETEVQAYSVNRSAPEARMLADIVPQLRCSAPSTAVQRVHRARSPAAHRVRPLKITDRVYPRSHYPHRTEIALSDDDGRHYVRSVMSGEQRNVSASNQQSIASWSSDRDEYYGIGLQNLITTLERLQISASRRNGIKYEPISPRVKGRDPPVAPNADEH